MSTLDKVIYTLGLISSVMMLVAIAMFMHTVHNHRGDSTLAMFAIIAVIGIGICLHRLTERKE